MPHELLLKLLSLLSRNKSRKEKNKSLIFFINDRSAVKGNAINAIWMIEHQKSVDITGEITHLQRENSMFSLDFSALPILGHKINY